MTSIALILIANHPDDIESALPQIAEDDGVSKLIDMVRYTWTVDKLEDMDLLEYLSEILQQVLLENGKMQ